MESDPINKKSSDFGAFIIFMLVEKVKLSL